MPTTRRFSSLFIATSAAALLAACGGKVVEGTAPDAGPVVEADAGVEPIVPATPETASLDVTAIADDSRVALSWVRGVVVPDVQKWVVFWGGPEGDYANKFEIPGGDAATSAILTGVESGKTYKLFVAGLTATGRIAPEVRDGSPLAASVAVTVTPGAPKRSEARDVLLGNFDCPNVMAFDLQNVAMIFRQDTDLISATSTNRGRDFAKGAIIDNAIGAVQAAADPARGLIVACYKKQDGLYIATSTDRGMSYTTQQLAADEGPSCSVALGMNGVFYVAAEAMIPGDPDAGTADTYEIRVHRTSDGKTFEQAVVAANPNSSGKVVIAADPKERSLAGKAIQMVYVGFDQLGTSGKRDVYVTASEDGAHSFRTNGGRVVQQMVHDPSIEEQRNPSLAVDPETGWLWVGYENRKSFTVSLSLSNNFCKTAPAGRIEWQPGNVSLGERYNPQVRVGAGSKLYVTFAAGARASQMHPYLTRFDLSLNGGAGAFEAPQPDAEVVMQLSTANLAADAADLSEYAGPVLGNDGIISDYIVWTTRGQRLIRGDFQLTVAP